METTTEFTIKGTMGQALPFTGTPAEAEANYETHSFDPENDRCVYCDCRPWGVWAQYPCNDGDELSPSDSSTLTVVRKIASSRSSRAKSLLLVC